MQHKILSCFGYIIDLKNLDSLYVIPVCVTWKYIKFTLRMVKKVLTSRTFEENDLKHKVFDLFWFATRWIRIDGLHVILKAIPNLNLICFFICKRPENTRKEFSNPSKNKSFVGFDHKTDGKKIDSLHVNSTSPTSTQNLSRLFSVRFSCKNSKRV